MVLPSKPNLDKKIWRGATLLSTQKGSGPNLDKKTQRGATLRPNLDKKIWRGATHTLPPEGPSGCS